jgi:hypothetical protein
MPTKLNQIVAVVTGKKTRTQKTLSDLTRRAQTVALFEGMTRTYEPLDEEGETLPPETKRMQATARQTLAEARTALAELMDVTLTQDIANCQAKADLVVDGRTLLADVPVTHLMFLEKQLQELRAFLEKLPTLDPAEQWTWNEAADCWATERKTTNRTRKVKRSHVLYEATEKHPAQVESYDEDVKAGEWHTVRFSGAIPQQRKGEMLKRAETLIDAVKAAREQANAMEVEQQKGAQALLGYVLQG